MPFAPGLHIGKYRPLAVQGPIRRDADAAVEPVPARILTMTNPVPKGIGEAGRVQLGPTFLGAQHPEPAPGLPLPGALTGALAPGRGLPLIRGFQGVKMQGQRQQQSAFRQGLLRPALKRLFVKRLFIKSRLQKTGQARMGPQRRHLPSGVGHPARFIQ